MRTHDNRVIGDYLSVVVLGALDQVMDLERGSYVVGFYLDQYMVSDLIQGVKSSPGPDLRLPVPGDDLPLFPEVDEDPLPSVVDEGRLQELLTATVAPDKWDGSPYTMGLLSGVAAS